MTDEAKTTPSRTALLREADALLLELALLGFMDLPAWAAAMRAVNVRLVREH